MSRLLLVDDDPINLEIMADCIGTDEHQLRFANDGEEAWTMLEGPDPEVDLVVLDRMMPRMDGMALLEKLRGDHRFEALPVIMQTAADAPEDIEAGLAAGAWYYLAKPYTGQALESIVRAALTDQRGKRELAELDAGVDEFLGSMVAGRMRFRELHEVRPLAKMLARFSAPERRAVVAMGLTELLQNAIEHGNLGFGYADKSQMLRDGTWRDALLERLAEPEQADRWGFVDMRREGDSLVFTVEDQGAGFDWKSYMKMDPKRAFDLHGRGIATANAVSFSALRYLGAGNRVEATVPAASFGDES